LSDGAKIEVADGVAKLIGQYHTDTVLYNSLDDTDYTCEDPNTLDTCEDTSTRDTTNQKFGASCVKITEGDEVSWRQAGTSFFSGANSTTGTLSFWYRPGYTGNPTGQVLQMCSIGASNACGTFNLNRNVVRLRHLTGGNIQCLIYDHSNTLKVSQSVAWSPTANTWYHFELNWDGSSGATRLFIDGSQQWLDSTTFTRDESTYPTDRLTVESNTTVGMEDVWFDDVFILESVLHTANFTKPSVAGPALTYPSDKPYVQPTSEHLPTEVTAWTGFTETLGGNNEGSIGYILSSDDGTTWEYWNGGAWVVDGDEDGTNSSSASDINDNIVQFDNNPSGFLFRAFLISDGSQQVELDNLNLAYAETDHTWPFVTSGNYTISDTDKIEVADGVVKLKAIHNVLFYNSMDDNTADPNIFDCETPSGLAYCSSSGIASSDATIKWNRSLYLNNSTSSLRFRNTSGNSFWSGGNSNIGTVSFWVNPGSSGAPPDVSRLITIGYASVCGTPEYNNEIMITHSNDGNLYAIIRDKDQNNIFVILYSWSPVAGTWYHIELDWDVSSGSSRLYIDGTEVTSSASTGDRTDTTYKTNQVSFGADRSQISFVGYIDDVSVLDGVVHTSNFTVPSQAGTVQYPFDKPYVEPASAFDPSVVSDWLGMAHVIQTGSATDIGYILSDDGKSTWKYWDGAVWSVTAGDGTNYNSISEIDVNMTSFDASPDTLAWRAFLISDGIDLIELDSVTLTYSTNVISLDASYIRGVIDLIDNDLGYVRGEFTLQQLVDEFLRGVVDQVNSNAGYLSVWNPPVTIVANFSDYIRGRFTLQDTVDDYIRGVLEIIINDLGYIRGVVTLSDSNLGYLQGTITSTIQFAEMLPTTINQVGVNLGYLRSIFDVIPYNADYIRGIITLVDYVPPARDSIIVQRLEPTIVEVS
jgi:hypothetical protein